MTMTTYPEPVEVKHEKSARRLVVSWDDGHVSTYELDYLRSWCPCAGCQGHSGTIKFVGGHNLEIREIERVGNYALGFTWGDAHASGIYTFIYLRRLCDLLEVHGAEGLEGLGELSKDA